MKIGKYDEFQLANRHRIAFHTMILVMVLVWSNGFFKESYGTWASPQIEALVLLYLPGMYFAVMSIAKNAYLRKKDSSVLIISLFSLIVVLGLFTIIPSILEERFTLVENGQLNDRIGSLLVTGLFSAMLITLLIRKRIDKHQMRDLN